MSQGLESPRAETTRTPAPSGGSTAAAGQAGKPIKKELRGKSFSDGEAMVQMDQASGGVPPGRPPAPSPDQELKSVVGLQRKDQLAAINDYLDDVSISNSDVEKILRVLEPLDGPTIGALLGGLKPDVRKDYVENINPPHVGRWRREVLESCFAAWPSELKELDWEVIGAMDLAGLSPREKFEVGYVLRNLPKGTMEDILDSKNRDPVKALMLAPSTYGKEEIEADTRKALEKETGRKKERTAEAEAMKDTKLAKTGQSMIEILDDLIVTDAQATQVLDWFAGIVVKPGENPALDEGRIRALAHHLEAQKYLDTFIDNVPQAARWAKGKRSQAFFMVLKARSPDKNMKMAEDLLSYGVFDWAITDEEAKLAYYLVKSMPPAMQERFRRADDSEWFKRMEHEQGAEMLAAEKKEEKQADGSTKTTYETEYKGVETEVDPNTGEIVDVSEKYTKLLEQKANGDAYAAALALFEGDKLTPDNARKLYTLLSGHPDPAGLKAIVRRLDTANKIAIMCEVLGNDFLLSDTCRLTSLRIFMARDPVQQAIHARELVGYRFGDLNVNSEEALLAYNLIKALPEGERKAFVESEQGKWWKRIEGHLTVGQKEAASTNPYTGGEGGKDHDSLRAQLLDDANWKKAAAAKLDGLIRMAVAAGDGAWVFKRSQDLEAYEEVPELVTKHHLFHPETTLTYKPEATRDLEGGNVVGEGLELIDKSDKIVTSSYLGGQGVNLAEAQDVTGGTIAGLRFERHENLGEEGQKALATHKGVNYADDAKFDTNNGVIDLDAPDIALAAIAMMVGDKKISTKAGTLKGLKVTFRYPTPDNPKPVYLEARASSVDIADIMVVSPGAMQTMNHVGFKGFFAKIARPGMTKEDIAKAASEDRVPIPIIGGIVSSLVNFFRDFAAQGAAMGKAFTDPGSPLGIELSMDDLAIDGFTTSAGQSIEKVAAKDVSLAGGQTKSAFLEAKSKSLEKKIAAASGDKEKVEKLTAEKKKVDAELPGERKKDAELFALQDKYRKDPKAFTPDDQSRLDALQKQQMSGGMVMDVGEASLKGLGGNVSAGDVNLKNLHGEGSGEAMGFGLLTDGKLVEDFVKKGSPAKGKDTDALKGASAHVELGDVEVKDLKVKAAIPDLDELDKALAVLTKKIEAGQGNDSDVASRAELEAQRPDVARYHELRALGLTTLKPAEQTEFQALHAKLSGKLSLEVKRIALRGASLDLGVGKDLKSAAVGVGAEKLDVEGLKAGTLSVGSIHGENVKVGAEGSLTDGLDLRKGLRSGNVGADLLSAKGIKDTKADVEIDEVRIEKLQAGVTNVQDDAIATVNAGKIEITGINLTGQIKMMEAEYAKLNAVPADKLKPEQKARKAELDRALKEHVVLRQKVADAKADLEKAKGSAKEATAKAEVARAEGALKSWSQVAARLTITDVSVVASGLGKVTDANYDPKAALADGASISGTGPDGQMIGGVEAQGVKSGGMSAELAKLSGLKGSVAMKGDEVSFSKLGIASASVSGLRYGGGGTSLAVTGSATVAGMSMTGRVKFKEVKNAETGAMEKKPDRAHIDAFDIAEIAGSGIELGMPARNISLSIPTGRVGKIWARDIDIALPEKDGGETKVTGSAGLGSWDLPALQAKIGQGLQYHGSLSGSGLRVGLAADGKREIDLEKLDAHGVVTMAQGTTIKVGVTGLAGKVTQQGDDIVLSKVRVADLALGGGTTWAGAGKRVDIGKKAALHGVYVDARIKTKTKGEGDKAETEIASLVLDSVVVDSIVAEDVHASIDAVKEDEAKGIEKSDAKRIDLAKATINGLRITGLDVMAQKGNIHVDKADIAGLHAAVGNVGAESLKANVSLQGTGMDLTLVGPDRQIIDFGETNIQGDVETDGAKAGFDVKKLKGKVETAPDGMVLSNMSLAGVTVPYAKYAAPGTLVQLDKGGSLTDVTLERCELKYMMEAPAPGAKPVKKLRSAVVKELKFGKINTNVLTYSGASVATDDKGVKTVSSTTMIMKSAELTNLFVHDLNADLFAGKTSLNAELEKADVKGMDAAFQKTVGSDKAVTYALAGDLFANSLKADVTAQSASTDGAPFVPLSGTASLGSAGLTNFVLKKDSNVVASGDKLTAEGKDGGPAVKATMDGTGTKVETGDIKGSNVKVPIGSSTMTLNELNAMGASVQLGPTGDPQWAIVPKLTVGSKAKGALPGFAYTDNGVTVNVKTGEATDVRLDWSGGKMTAAKIGSITLNDGDFELSTNDMPTSKGGGGTPAPDMGFTKGLNGSVNVQFYWHYDLPVGGIENTENVTMKITNGVFDAQAFENAFGNAVDWFAIDFSSDLFKSSHGSVGLLHLNIGGDKVSIPVDEETERAFADKGQMKLADLVKLVDQFVGVQKKKAREQEAREKETGKKETSDLYLPLDRVKVDADLTVAPGTEITFPRVGKIKLGESDGPKSNHISVKGSPGSAIDIGLDDVALNSIDWKTAGVDINTGRIDIGHVKTNYDAAAGKVTGKLTTATIKDANVKF